MESKAVDLLSDKQVVATPATACSLANLRCQQSLENKHLINLKISDDTLTYLLTYGNEDMILPTFDHMLASTLHTTANCK